MTASGAPASGTPSSSPKDLERLGVIIVAPDKSNAAIEEPEGRQASTPYLRSVRAGRRNHCRDRIQVGLPVGRQSGEVEEAPLGLGDVGGRPEAPPAQVEPLGCAGDVEDGGGGEEHQRGGEGVTGSHLSVRAVTQVVVAGLVVAGDVKVGGGGGRGWKEGKRLLNGRGRKDTERGEGKGGCVGCHGRLRAIL